MKKVQIGEVAAIHHGFAFPSSGFVEYQTPYCLLTPGNFLPNGGFQAGKPKFFDGEVKPNFILAPGDILISMTDLSRNIDTLGSPLTVPKNHRWSYLHNQRLGKLIITSDFVNRSWLYQRLRMADYRHYVAATSTGTTVHHTSPKTISTFEFQLPPLKTQRSIALLLGSLDDKIAANQTAVSTGSELLMSLYRGVQKYAAEPFSQACDVFGGSTPSTKIDEYWGGSINWATPTDLTALQGPWLTDTERKITEAGLKSMSSALHPSGSILMASRATIGHVAVAATPVTTNQGFIVIRTTEDLVPWIFCQLQDRVREFEAWSNGATFLEISRGNFKKLPFYRAEPQDLAEFNAKAKPLLNMCKAKQAENITLAKTRDELLPLLMNGKITVREAGQEAAAAGAQIPSEENEV
ncbi:restriction endonuclease subunit S [Corynebacterium amycolatum]|uniref:restriction endonuclease subunit S n=1 Tax=Corynebacterium amycolatum TaxID=43765 RepID=UPI00211A71D6|nr:restriction endonuclease subunit S [Corynebacterium amycolatum]MCQ9125677.1 restriction endonuclease subunit S [Corynebacterium amycolatum]MCQ9169692.1 restriction endonuclease subunit S [Corynebacterium amycolatum]MCQ9175633.1 restriction endonuclease subunit S [Corynebacterium amycolatum]